jgi:arsenate reductase
MKKIWHLATCNTNQKILKELAPGPEIRMQEIKTEAITPEQIDEMAKLAGSYEALFSRRSMKFRQWDLAGKALTEKDYRDLILKEYTFLKRPVMILDGRIFIGNAKKTIEAAKEAMNL